MAKQQIIYISSIPWDYAWHRQQEMMSKMVEKGFEVLFVQPCAKNPFKKATLKKEAGVWLFTPSGLPYERVLRIVNAYNARRARKQLIKAMKQIGFSNAILWMDRVHGFDFSYFSKNTYVIYDLIDDVKALLSGMLTPDTRENVLGSAEVRKVFEVSKVGKIAGCMVLDGIVRRGAKVRLIRNGIVVHTGSIKSVRREKDDVKEARAGFECGIMLENYNDIHLKDIIECFEIEEVARKL